MHAAQLVLPLLTVCALLHYFQAPCFVRCLLQAEAAQDACMRVCAGDVALGSVPLAYIVDLQTVSRHGYFKALCRTPPGCANDGPDMSHHSGGWERTDNGSWVGCEVTRDFPGPSTVGYNTHARVRHEMRTVAARHARGEIWRGNEFGMHVWSGLFWEDVEPKAVGLGMPAGQRAAVRPFIETLLDCTAACEARVQHTIASHLATRSTLDALPDTLDLLQVVLHEAMFPGHPYPFDLAEFREAQERFTTLQVPALVLPKVLGRMLVAKTQAVLTKHLAHYKRLAELRFGDALRQADCSPSTSCLALLAHAILDMFVVLGGLSLPHALKNGLFVLFGNTQPYGDIFPKHPAVAARETTLFFWEVLRFFAPVASFPYWDKPPGQPGRSHTLLHLVLANRDPNVWGGGSHLFRMRPLRQYREAFVGFADFAGGPGTPYRCPGKHLALVIGKQFYRHFLNGSWVIDPSHSPAYVPRFPYVSGDFTLHRIRATDVDVA